MVLDLEEATATGEVDLANALDLSESEDEEEYEDLIHDFALQAELEQVTVRSCAQVWFFNFIRYLGLGYPTRKTLLLSIS